MAFVPKEKTHVGSTNSIGIELLQHDMTPQTPHYTWQPMSTFTATSENDEARTNRIKNNIFSPQINQNRQKILKKLGFNSKDDVKLANPESMAKSFVIAPQVK